MRFDQSVWDDTDPDYAPCLKQIRGSFYWIPPARYKKAGYAIKTYRLDMEDHQSRAAHCRELTREMLKWFDGETNGRNPGTWGWLISRYKGDEHSAIWDVRPGTREGYLKELAIIEDAIGNVKISATDYERMVGWKKGMEKKGRSVHYIKKWFTHFGLVVSHGIKLREPGCADVKAIRSEMRIKNPPRRSKFITRTEVDQIVRAADAKGWHQLSLSVLIRFEYMLRGIDVYGQWEPLEDRQGGIQYDGRLWDGGLTWEMFDPGLHEFQKVISKTRDSLPEPYVFKVLPDIRARLQRTPEDKRIGPVIVMEDGLPPRHDRIVKQFRQVKDDLGLPDYLQIRDTRSGGITEAKTLVDGYSLRDAAQHTQITTTDIYARGRSESANNVVMMRQASRKNG